MSNYLKTNFNANFTQTNFTLTNYGIRILNLDLTKWVNKSVWGEASRRKYHFESGKTSGCEWNLPYKHKEPAQTLAGHGGKHVLMAQVAIPGPLSTSTLLCLSSTVHTDCTGEVRYSLSNGLPDWRLNKVYGWRWHIKWIRIVFGKRRIDLFGIIARKKGKNEMLLKFPWYSNVLFYLGFTQFWVLYSFAAEKFER